MRLESVLSFKRLASRITGWRVGCTMLAEEKEAAEATELAETKETPAVAEEASASEEANAKDESSESEEAVEEALENAEAEASTVPVSTPAEEPTVHDKFRKAFDLDGWELKN